MQDVTRAQHRVLVVEDETIVLEAATERLLKAGFQVITATNGSQALKQAEQLGGVDVLFTDVREVVRPQRGSLPGHMDGLDLAAKLKQLDLCRAVIYTTGYTYDPPRMVSPSLLLRKPYGATALIRAIHGLINLATATASV